MTSKGVNNMVYFNERKKLEDLYIKWVEENKVANCPFNVISILEIKGLLNEKKVKELLEEIE